MVHRDPSHSSTRALGVSLDISVSSPHVDSRLKEYFYHVSNQQSEFYIWLRSKTSAGMCLEHKEKDSLKDSATTRSTLVPLPRSIPTISFVIPFYSLPHLSRQSQAAGSYRNITFIERCCIRIVTFISHYTQPLLAWNCTPGTTYSNSLTLSSLISDLSSSY